MIKPHKFLTFWYARFFTFCFIIITPLKADILTTGVGGESVALTYSGPGDVTGFTTGILFWWGLRGFSSATTGAIFNVCDNATGVTCADATWSSSGGGILTLPIIGGNACDNATHKCEVAILYDQSGQNGCNNGGGPSPCDTKNTHVNRPLLVINCNGSKPCLGITNNSLKTAPFAITASTSQPYTSSAVSIRTVVSGGSFSAIAAAGSNTSESLYTVAANGVGMFAGGSVPSATAADNVIHTFQFLFNNTSSIIYVDNTSNAVNLGTANAIGLGSSAAFPSDDNGGLTGQSFEAGYWAGDKSANFSNMHTNQCNYWGITC